MCKKELSWSPNLLLRREAFYIYVLNTLCIQGPQYGLFAHFLHILVFKSSHMTLLVIDLYMYQCELSTLFLIVC